eukprot:CAMPEP_0183710856 /NCGR_PEP_ID=MMETSP0737-20130205/6485_1 /TAXON_ID=385413 /ORGANISM="Thalassiosira miniscula, Strain CCMP1093" /LENGTH=350 /DNA_ID=CAMNT_0025939219 /DNA_START=286 /DNA_END=1334 /DNA_ORIENTATION=-
MTAAASQDESLSSTMTRPPSLTGSSSGSTATPHAPLQSHHPSHAPSSDRETNETNNDSPSSSANGSGRNNNPPIEPTRSQTMCDDASYFDGEWVSHTVQSAVTHFFGESASGEQDEHDDAEEETKKKEPPLLSSAAANASLASPWPASSSSTAGEQSSSTASASLSLASAQQPSAASAPSMAAAFASADQTNGALTVNASPSLPLPTVLSTARSLSPSFSLFSNHPGCGIYNNLSNCNDSNSQPVDPAAHHAVDEDDGASIVQCVSPSNSAGAANNDANATNTGNNNTNNNSNYQPHFLPSDFTPQTWSAVLASHTTTLQYSITGAAVLTAAIVIHPLSWMGAGIVTAAG